MKEATLQCSKNGSSLMITYVIALYNYCSEMLVYDGTPSRYLALNRILNPQFYFTKGLLSLLMLESFLHKRIELKMVKMVNLFLMKTT